MSNVLKKALQYDSLQSEKYDKSIKKAAQNDIGFLKKQLSARA